MAHLKPDFQIAQNPIRCT